MPRHVFCERVGLVGQYRETQPLFPERGERFRDAGVGAGFVGPVFAVYFPHADSHFFNRPVGGVFRRGGAGEVHYAPPDKILVRLNRMDGKAELLQHGVHAVGKVLHRIHEGAVEIENDRAMPHDVLHRKPFHYSFPPRTVKRRARIGNLFGKQRQICFRTVRA